MQTPQDRAFRSTFGMGCFVTQLFFNSKLPFPLKSMQNARLAVSSSERHLHTVALEITSFAESLAQLANTDRSYIRHKSCFVLTMGQATDLRRLGELSRINTGDGVLEKAIELQIAWQVVWNELQQDLVSRFNGAHQIIAEKSDHAIILHQPELVVHAVKALVFQDNASRAEGCFVTDP